jgi:hypothetical protein
MTTSSPNTCHNLLSNLCWPQVESDEPRRHCIFIGTSISIFISGKPYLQRPLFQTNIKKQYISLFALSYAQTPLTRTLEMSLILNFLTEISIIEGNPQTLPQIRIDDVEAESCLNVTAIICPNNLRLIIICRLGT